MVGGGAQPIAEEVLPVEAELLLPAQLAGTFVLPHEQRDRHPDVSLTARARTHPERLNHRSCRA